MKRLKCRLIKTERGHEYKDEIVTFKGRGNAVGNAAGYGLDDGGIGVRVPLQSVILIFCIVQTSSGVHPASYLMGTSGSFSGSKAARE
jgi:hypothetical protein